MVENDAILDEVIELLKIWHTIYSKGHHWPEAKQALEKKINLLLKEVAIEDKSE